MQQLYREYRNYMAVTGNKQVFKNPPIDLTIKLKEELGFLTTYKLNHINFIAIRSDLISCAPQKD